MINAVRFNEVVSIVTCDLSRGNIVNAAILLQINNDMTSTVQWIVTCVPV